MWRRGFPVEAGYFWFYGYIFGKPTSFEKPRLEQLQVRKISNGFAYIACNSFINPTEMLGFWQPNLAPDTSGLDEQLPPPVTS